MTPICGKPTCPGCVVDFMRDDTIAFGHVRRVWCRADAEHLDAIELVALTVDDGPPLAGLRVGQGRFTLLQTPDVLDLMRGLLEVQDLMDESGPQ